MPSESPDYENDPIRQYLRYIGQYELLTAEEAVSLATQIQAGNQAAAILNTYETEGTQPENPELLEAAVAEGKQAFTSMYQANLRLVVSVAKKYTHNGTQFMDLIQEGNIGLMTAVERFDPDKGFKFSTYATWWIRQSIGHSITKTSNMIYIPEHDFRNTRSLRRVELELEQEGNGVSPTHEKVAAVMGISVEKLRDLKRSRDINSMIALDAPIGDDKDTKHGDTVGASGHFDVEDEVLQRKHASDIAEVVLSAGLNQRERQILELRFGLQDGKDRSLEEVGREVGLTGTRIRQILDRAKRKIRRELMGRELMGSEDLPQK